jgi:RNA polymerase sigma factor (sigma-70 family)
MTDGEARALCAAAQQGDIDARDSLTTAHRRLVELVAFDWVRAFAGAAKSHHTGAEDLVQMAYIILIEEVIPTYRTEGPVPFRSYARRRINAGMWRTLKFEVRQKNLLDKALPYLAQSYIDRVEHSRADDDVIAAEIPKVVRDLLDWLVRVGDITAQHRSAMRLVVKGWPGRRIAQKLGISSKRTYALISEARAAIQEVIDYAF